MPEFLTTAQRLHPLRCISRHRPVRAGADIARKCRLIAKHNHVVLLFIAQRKGIALQLPDVKSISLLHGGQLCEGSDEKDALLTAIFGAQQFALEQVYPAPGNYLTLRIEQGHESKTLWLAHFNRVRDGGFGLLALLQREPFQVQADITRAAKDVAQTLFALADLQVLFTLVHSKTRLGPFHLLHFLAWKAHAHALIIDPYAAARVFIAQDQHRQEYHKSDNAHQVAYNT